MNHNQKLAVFRAQTENVRSLESSIKMVRRSINSALRNSDTPVATSFTKIYATLFCGWAEANFYKMLHTPHGFGADEIQQIQTTKQKGIAVAWKKCVELGLRHLEAKRGSFSPNARKKLNALIDTHVFDPSVLRNKLAHGQWQVALNRNHNGVQAEITSVIGSLDLVKIDAWMSVHRQLAEAIETLIESPKRAFMRDWYALVVNIEENVVKMKGRSIQSHIDRLRAKDARTGAAAKRGVD